MITELTFGLGVDYSLHISERFTQELPEAETVAAALHETVTGTGSALLSSAARTASGFAVLLVAILPFFQSFGLITALTIVFAFLASVFVLPNLLVVWMRFIKRDAGPERFNTVTAAGSPGNGEVNADMTRTIHHSYLSPGQVIPVIVSLQNVRNRMVLRETVAGEISDIEIAVERDDITPTPTETSTKTTTSTPTSTSTKIVSQTSTSTSIATPGFDLITALSEIGRLIYILKRRFIGEDEN